MDRFDRYKMEDQLRLAMYKYPPRACTDIEQLVQSYPNLLPSMEQYTFVDGRSARLLRLDGTIAVRMQSSGVEYNYPVQMWLLQDYPELPPLAYVRPTKTMKVNPKHKHLDSNGQVYLPFLHLWSQLTHNLAGLGLELTKAFSVEAPVHAIAAQAPQQQSSWGGGGGGGAAYGGQQQHNTQPRNPYATPTPTPTQPQPYSPYTQQQQQQQQQEPSWMPTIPPPQQTEATQRENSEDTAVMRQVMKDSLVADKDTMLNTQLTHLKRATEERLTKPRQVQAALQNGRSKIAQVETKLEADARDVNNGLQFYEQRMPGLESTVAVLEATKAQPMNVDTVVVATQPLYNQIIQLQAESDSYEDLSRYMSSHVTEATDVSKLVKTLRVGCYKKQFMVMLQLEMANKAAAAADVAGR